MKRERCPDRLCGADDCPTCYPAIDAADLEAAIDAADLAADGDRSAAEERDDVDPAPWPRLSPAMNRTGGTK